MYTNSWIYVFNKKYFFVCFYLLHLFCFVYRYDYTCFIIIKFCYFREILSLDSEYFRVAKKLKSKFCYIQELNKTAYFLADSFWLHIKREDVSKRFDEKQFLIRVHFCSEATLFIWPSLCLYVHLFYCLSCA